MLQLSRGIFETSVAPSDCVDIDAVPRVNSMGQAVSPMQESGAQCLRLSAVDWRTYSRLLRAFAERPGIRLAYDRGELEMMAPLLAHDDDAWFLGYLVLAL